MEKKIRTRFAPSPTGHLHIGSARTALFNYLYAKKHGGDYILRIEDTDLKRNVEGAQEKFEELFKWLGINWDEGPGVGGSYGPYTCMERLDIYKSHVDTLLSEGKAYEKDGAIYLRVPKDHAITFHDEIYGDMNFDSNLYNDFVIVKSNGIPVYNFQVVIDDHLMEISHVIRGQEHLSNTPFQVLVYDSFGWESPIFAHVPLILGANGKKLSKRDKSIVQFIEQYRDMGYLPEGILNFLVLLGWSSGTEQELFTMDELSNPETGIFSLSRILKAGAVFDSQKLNAINGEYIKKYDVDTLVSIAIPILQDAGLIEEEFDHDWLSRLVSLYQKTMKFVGQLPSLTPQFFSENLLFDLEAVGTLVKPDVPTVLTTFLEKVKGLSNWNPDNLKALLKETQKDTGIKGKGLFMPIRVSTTGQCHGPDLEITLDLLGKEKVISRLEMILDTLK